MIHFFSFHAKHWHIFTLLMKENFWRTWMKTSRWRENSGWLLMHWIWGMENAWRLQVLPLRMLNTITHILLKNLTRTWEELENNNVRKNLRRNLSRTWQELEKELVKNLKIVWERAWERTWQELDKNLTRTRQELDKNSTRTRQETWQGTWQELDKYLRRNLTRTWGRTWEEIWEEIWEET